MEDNQKTITKYEFMKMTKSIKHRGAPTQINGEKQLKTITIYQRTIHPEQKTVKHQRGTNKEQ